MLSAAMMAGEMAGMETESSQRFHDDLMNGLHAVAQPLTVLRAAIEVLSRPEAAGIDHRNYLEISAKQVARTCDLFASVRDLVSASVLEPQLADFDLWELLSPVIEEQTARLQASGIGLAVVRHDRWQPILGDAERTLQGFRAMLKTAVSLAAHGDVIEIHTAHTPGYAEINLMNARSHGKKLNSSDRLGLSLAQISILSQQGKYSCADDPFCCWFALPVEQTVPSQAGVAGQQIN